MNCHCSKRLLFQVKEVPYKAYWFNNWKLGLLLWKANRVVSMNIKYQRLFKLVFYFLFSNKQRHFLVFRETTLWRKKLSEQWSNPNCCTVVNFALMNLHRNMCSAKMTFPSKNLSQQWPFGPSINLLPKSTRGPWSTLIAWTLWKYAFIHCSGPEVADHNTTDEGIRYAWSFWDNSYVLYSITYSNTIYLLHDMVHGGQSRQIRNWYTQEKIWSKNKEIHNKIDITKIYMWFGP